MAIVHAAAAKQPVDEALDGLAQGVEEQHQDHDQQAQQPGQRLHGVPIQRVAVEAQGPPCQDQDQEIDDGSADCQDGKGQPPAEGQVQAQQPIAQNGKGDEQGKEDQRR